MCTCYVDFTVRPCSCHLGSAFKQLITMLWDLKNCKGTGNHFWPCSFHFTLSTFNSLILVNKMKFTSGKILKRIRS